ncbi:unnamed protein product [Effrenium voratum]|nr:unnamed protein product [Effrenium voratum]
MLQNVQPGSFVKALPNRPGPAGKSIPVCSCSGNQTSLGMLAAVTLTVAKHRKPSARIFRKATGVQLSPKLQAFLETANAGGVVAPGKGGNASIEGIARAEAVWQKLKAKALQQARAQELDPPPTIVRRYASAAPVDATQSYDVVVCGGTLGILVARALQNEGYSVCIVERGVVKGRDQEWNVSCEELEPLVKNDIINQQDLDAAILSRWPKSRVGFEGTYAVEFRAGALNAGVSPHILVEAARRRFEEAGGQILEGAMLEGVDVFDDAALLRLTGRVIRARLVLDAMGAGSPIVAQARGGAAPDAACLVVGTMASGFPKDGNHDGDYLYSGVPTASGHQAFWEAFPSANGGADGTDRTTYFFTYVLPGQENLPSIPDVFEDYVESLPNYQKVSLEQLKVRRALCASFVAYKNSPLPTPFDRTLQVGDAAGIQSPLSFGGFGALCRHLPRLRCAIADALKHDLLGADDLSQINPYLPNLSMQWTMYRSIAKPPDQEPEFVNRMMGGILSAAERCGPDVMTPILQDVFSLSALVPTLASWMSRDPGVIPLFISSMGAENVMAAVAHLGALAVYTGAASLEPWLEPWVASLPAAERFRWRRRFEAWRYGSGLD